MSSLPLAPLQDLASDWVARVANALACHPASDVYCGRSFQEARAAAATIDAKLIIVSAGLGLVEASTPIPAYGCTVLVGADDGIQSRVDGNFSIASWWRALSSSSHLSRSLEDMMRGQPGPLLVALSEAYIEMLAPELIALPPNDLARVRIFTASPAARLPDALRPFRMPYDDRLDGPDSPCRGTLNDFASRALGHFVGLGRGIVPQASLDADVAAVRSALSTWRAAQKFDRARYDDDTMLKLIAVHWESAGGSASRLLRYFRDELDIACEQSRFAALARRVRETKK
jgi:hypothetical protein